MRQEEQYQFITRELYLEHQFIKQEDQRTRAYICSPLSAKTEEEFLENMHRARAYMHYATKEMGMAARAPHAYLPMLLCDRIPNERALALQFGLRLLEESDILLVCGDRISLGMQGEILHAISIRERILTFSYPVYKKVCEYMIQENGDMELVEVDESHLFMTGKEQIQTPERLISENEYTSLLDARDRLCHFCQSEGCEKCQVTRLADDAHFEAEKAGILSDS
ncbi:MAG: hypothetical protein K2J67_06565 [Lachnospiraceae bacterium]|nr:hypothetical protein [Lachnospiraceae bacterium]